MAMYIDRGGLHITTKGAHGMLRAGSEEHLSESGRTPSSLTGKNPASSFGEKATSLLSDDTRLLADGRNAEKAPPLAVQVCHAQQDVVFRNEGLKQQHQHGGACRNGEVSGACSKVGRSKTAPLANEIVSARLRGVSASACASQAVTTTYMRGRVNGSPCAG